MRERHRRQCNTDKQPAQRETAGPAAEAAEPSLAEGEAKRTDAADPAPDSEDGALSVTRPVPFSAGSDWKLLAAGLDSLDLGLCVWWSFLWPKQVEELERLKTAAAGSQGIPIWNDRCLMLPGGKPPMFRWHLQYPGFHIFLGKSDQPHEDTPNVYVSVNAETLWRHGALDAVALAVEEIRRLAGRVMSIKVSRADLAADFLIPGGLSLSFLLKRRVPNHSQHQHVMVGDRLETFYQGGKKSPIRCRIYDKGREVADGGTKFWFLSVWGIESLADVWRVEFQLRREVLKEMRIDSVEELLERREELWAYLTQKWFGVREPDNANATRRTVTPWWEAVQGAFGTESGMVLRCRPDDRPAETRWYINHCTGLLPGYAARIGEPDAAKALTLLSADVGGRLQPEVFAEAYARKRIALGRPVETDRTPPADAA